MKPLIENLLTQVVPIPAALVNQRTGNPVDPDELVEKHYIDAYRRKNLPHVICDYRPRVDELIELSRRHYEESGAELEVIDREKALVRVTKRAFDGSSVIHDYYLRLIEFGKVKT